MGSGPLITAWFLHGMLHKARHNDVALPSDAPSRQWLLGAGVIAIGLPCYGRVFPSQHVLQDLAMWLSGPSEVFGRRACIG